MKWYEIVGLISSFVSIGGAFYSYRYSTIIKKTKNEIFSTFKVLKFSNINEKTINTTEQIKKIAHKQKIPRGTNVDEIIKVLNDYFEKIFKLKNEKEVQNSNTLNILIQQYREKINAISRTPRSSEEVIIKLFGEIYEITLNIDKEFDKFTKNIVEQK
ncbi:MAG: hypothetical protein E2604_06950 [Flavobacterium sp.]|nr:hypothetical protein [Flavobacterium sp.]